MSPSRVVPTSARLVDFVTLLREHNIHAGPSETIDAAAAIVALGDADPRVLRAGLAACLLRRNGQRKVFDQLFDLYFLGVSLPPARPSENAEDLRERLVATLVQGEDTAELAREALNTFGAYGGAGRARAGSPRPPARAGPHT